jgi:hypothetical protein
VIVDLNFPSQETFLQSQFARVRVFDLSQDELGECPALLAEAIAVTTAADAAHDSDNVDVCDAFGGIAFDEIGEGPKAFVVTTSAMNEVILAGCTVAEVYPDAPAVTVHLAMTPRYAIAVTGTSPCMSIADKCERGCR